jgi:sugar phosphate isomerase/epimerase
MYIALNPTLTTGGKLSWPEFARLAAKLGYGGADIMKSAQSDGPEKTAALLAELKIKPAVVGFPVDFRKDDATFDSTFPKLEATAQFASAIGCPRMQTYILSSTDTPKAELRAIYKKRFTKCAEVLAKHKVRLALEFLGPLHIRKAKPHEFIYKMPEMLEFAKECGPNVGVLLDSWHWHHSGGKVADILAAGKDGVITVQVADAPSLAPEQIKDSERLLPGEGIIDWNAFFGALRKIGYDANISPEVFGRGLKLMPPEEGARLGVESTRSVMKKAGIAV